MIILGNDFDAEKYVVMDLNLAFMKNIPSVNELFVIDLEGIVDTVKLFWSWELLIFHILLKYSCSIPPILPQSPSPIQFILRDGPQFMFTRLKLRTFILLLSGIFIFVKISVVEFVVARETA